MFGRILIPTDFSRTSDAALDYGIELARRFAAEIYLLHVIEETPLGSPESWLANEPGSRDSLLHEAQQRLAHRLTELATVATARSEVIFGRPAETIAEYATERHIDVIVMGTHGRTGVAHLLLGSVAERVMRLAPCPVVTVRDNGVGTAVPAAPDRLLPTPPGGQAFVRPNFSTR